MKKTYSLALVLSLMFGTSTFALAEDAGGGTEPTEVSIEPIMDTGTTNTGGMIPPKPPFRPGNLPPGPVGENMLKKRIENASGTKPLPGEVKKMMERRIENASSGPKLPQGIKDRMGERMDEAKGKMMERRMDAAREFIKNTIQRLNNAIERLEKLADRAEQAMEKFKEKGVDVSTAEGLLATAQTKIDEAKTAVANAVSLIESAKPTTTGTTTGQISDSTRQAVKDAMEDAKEALGEAHRALIEVIKSLKAAGGVRPTPAPSPVTP